jgi:hypothetical protein
MNTIGWPKLEVAPVWRIERRPWSLLRWLFARRRSIAQKSATAAMLAMLVAGVWAYQHPPADEPKIVRIGLESQLDKIMEARKQ